MRKIKKFFAVIISSLVMATSVTGCDLFENGSIFGEYNQIDTTINITTVDSSETNYSSLVEMLEEVRPTVVEIYASLTNGISCGSGTIIADSEIDGKIYYYILTCHHVINGGNELKVKDVNGRTFTAKLIGGDPITDIAVIAICPQDDNLGDITLSKASIRKKTENVDLVKVGEDVVAIGNPLGTLGGTVTRGIISTIDREISVEGKKMVLIQTDCAINSGNSGGALFACADGSLVGVVNAGYSGNVEGLNFAIPSNIALNIAEQLMNNYTGVNYGYVEGRAYLKVFENLNNNGEMYDLGLTTYSYRDRLTNNISYYSVITYINENNALYKAGLRLDDVILGVKYDGNEISVTTENTAATKLVSELNNLKMEKGKELVFTVKANKTFSSIEETITVTLPQYIYMDTGDYTPKN